MGDALRIHVHAHVSGAGALLVAEQDDGRVVERVATTNVTTAAECESTLVHWAAFAAEQAEGLELEWRNVHARRTSDACLITLERERCQCLGDCTNRVVSIRVNSRLRLRCVTTLSGGWPSVRELAAILIACAAAQADEYTTVRVVWNDVPEVTA